MEPKTSRAMAAGKTHVPQDTGAQQGQSQHQDKGVPHMKGAFSSEPS